MPDNKPANAVARAHSGIRDAILRGEFAPGTMLSESSLAASMSMSRTPVRAALGRLQDEGFVTIYPQRGALVRAMTADEVRESAQVRHALELAGVQLAGPAARARLGEQLAENLDRQERALRDGDLPEFATVSLSFHRAFVELSNNATMLSFYDRLRDRQYLSILRSAPTLTHDPDRILAEHRGLLADAQAGDWVAFARDLRDHQSNAHDLE